MISPDKLIVLKKYIADIFSKSKELTVKEWVSDDEMILGNLACLIEEVGELSAEVRKKLKMSFSKKKVDTFNIRNLEDEAIDVFITLWLLLESLWVDDLDEAITRKIKKNDDRWYR